MLVSALMSTCNRRRFVPTAIRCFQAQTWPDRELIIVDDGEDAVGDLVPADPRIHYVRLHFAHSTRRIGRWPLREKRQAAFDSASPDAGVYMLWDDDDWHGPDRMRRQALELAIKGGACLLDPILFHELAAGRTWRWSARGRYQMAVGTLAFTRAYYDLVPGGFPAFRETHSDQQFVRDRPWTEVSYVAGEDLYVAVRHGGNSSDCTIVPGGAWTEAPSCAGRLSY